MGRQGGEHVAHVEGADVGEGGVGGDVIVVASDEVGDSHAIFVVVVVASFRLFRLFSFSFFSLFFLLAPLVLLRRRVDQRAARTQHLDQLRSNRGIQRGIRPNDPQKVAPGGLTADGGEADGAKEAEAGSGQSEEIGLVLHEARFENVDEARISRPRWRCRSGCRSGSGSFDG